MHTGNELMESLITENGKLRALLREAHRELTAIDANGMTPSPPDEFVDLIWRIGEALDQ